MFVGKFQAALSAAAGRSESLGTSLLCSALACLLACPLACRTLSYVALCTLHYPVLPCPIRCTSSLPWVYYLYSVLLFVFHSSSSFLAPRTLQCVGTRCSTTSSCPFLQPSPQPSSLSFIAGLRNLIGPYWLLQIKTMWQDLIGNRHWLPGHL